MDWQPFALGLLFLTQLIIVIILIRLSRRSDTTAADSVQTTLLELKSEIISKQMEGLISLRQSLDDTGRTVNERLAEGNESLQQRLEIINAIQQQLGRLTKQTDNIEEIGKNIQALSALLKPPKQRGMVGEVMLENILRDMLPVDLISMQYSFKDNQRVDAAVKIGDHWLPIDSKFPLESFQRLISAETEADKLAAAKEFKTAVKKHIDSVAKYIRPDEQTLEFALMYLPSEAIYGYVIGPECIELFEQALHKKVIPTSPGHIYGFLLTVTSVLGQLRLEQNSRQITALLAQIELSCHQLDDYQQRLSGSLRSAGQSLDKSNGVTADIIHRLETIKELGISGNHNDS